MQVTEMRRQIAPLFGLSPEALRNKQQGLYRDPVLRAEMPARNKAGQRATYGAASLVVLSAMINLHPNNIAPIVRQLWEAPCVYNELSAVIPNVDPVSEIMSVDELSAMMPGVKFCGTELILLLEHADLRANLDRLEVNQDVPQVSLVWRDGRRTTFAPFETPEAWLQRVGDVLDAGMTRATQFSSGALSKIAALITE